MMEQDPESTQYTQTQRGKAEVRNGTRGGGAARGCLSGPGARGSSATVLRTGGFRGLGSGAGK